MGQHKLWVLEVLRCISFREISGFKLHIFSDSTDMWNVIYAMLDVGYKVQ